MRVLPRSRLRRAGIASVLVLLAVSSPLWWSKAVFAFKLVFPSHTYAAAADRTSDPAPVGEALPLPTVSSAPPSAAGRPTIALADVADLEGASAVADPPGPGPVLVTTLDGRVHRLDVATGEHEVVLDLSGEISTGGERGLLGAAIDPAGERLYLDYTDDGGDTDIRSWPLDPDGRPVGGPGDGVLHLEIGQPFENHNGGNLVFGPDGALWIGTGDGGGAGDRGDVAQDPDSLLGKMLRVVPDPAGGVVAPSTNPDRDGRPEVWAVGLRNPWRYSFDRVTGRLWIGDVGQNTIEEVSVIDPSADRPNLGWSILEGNNHYKGDAEPGFTAPVVTYSHDDGCSVAGGYVYRGTDVPALEGWYVFGDYCGGWVRAVPSDAPETEPVPLLEELGPVVAFAELDDGELLVLRSDDISRVVAAVPS
jgi:glucose/arabinose dehydrogenase